MKHIFGIKKSLGRTVYRQFATGKVTFKMAHNYCSTLRNSQTSSTTPFFFHYNFLWIRTIGKQIKKKITPNSPLPFHFLMSTCPGMTKLNWPVLALHSLFHFLLSSSFNSFPDSSFLTSTSCSHTLSSADVLWFIHITQSSFNRTYLGSFKSDSNCTGRQFIFILDTIWIQRTWVSTGRWCVQMAGTYSGTKWLLNERTLIMDWEKKTLCDKKYFY